MTTNAHIQLLNEVRVKTAIHNTGCCTFCLTRQASFREIYNIHRCFVLLTYWFPDMIYILHLLKTYYVTSIKTDGTGEY